MASSGHRTTRSTTRRLHGEAGGLPAEMSCRHCQATVLTVDYISHSAKCKRDQPRPLDTTQDSLASEFELDSDDDNQSKQNSNDSAGKKSSNDDKSNEGDSQASNDSDDGGSDEEGDENGSEASFESMRSTEVYTAMEGLDRRLVEDHSELQRFVHFQKTVSVGNTKRVQFGMARPDMTPVVILSPHENQLPDSKLTNAERFDKDIRGHKFLEGLQLAVPKLLYYSVAGKFAVIERWDNTLMDYFRQTGPLNGTIAHSILLKAAVVLRHLHKRRIRHMDVGSNNFVEKWNAEQRQLQIGMIDFESIRKIKKTADSLADIAGFGQLIADCLGLMRVVPFYGTSLDELDRSAAISAYFKQKISSENVRPFLALMEDCFRGNVSMKNVVKTLRHMPAFNYDEEVRLEEQDLAEAAKERDELGEMLKESKKKAAEKKEAESRKVALLADADSSQAEINRRREALSRKTDKIWSTALSSPVASADSQNARASAEKSILDDLLSDGSGTASPRRSKAPMKTSSPVNRSAKKESSWLGSVDLTAAGTSGVSSKKTQQAKAQSVSAAKSSSTTTEQLEARQKEVFPKIKEKEPVSTKTKSSKKNASRAT